MSSRRLIAIALAICSVEASAAACEYNWECDDKSSCDDHECKKVEPYGPPDDHQSEPPRCDKPLWLGEELGLRLSSVKSGAMIGWEGGKQILAWHAGTCMSLGLGARLVYSRRFEVAPVLRFSSGEGLRQGYVQAGPLLATDGGVGINAQVGVDWTLLAIFVDAHDLPHERAVTLGVRFSIEGLIWLVGLRGPASD